MMCACVCVLSCCSWCWELLIREECAYLLISSEVVRAARASGSFEQRYWEDMVRTRLAAARVFADEVSYRGFGVHGRQAAFPSFRDMVLGLYSQSMGPYIGHPSFGERRTGHTRKCASIRLETQT